MEKPLNNIRDLTIRQWRRPWKSRWKIDLASFQTISRLFKVAQILQRREFMLEFKRGGHSRVQTKMIAFIASPSPSSKKYLKIGPFTSQSCSDGKEMYKKTWCTCRVVVLPIKTYCFFAVLFAVAVIVSTPNKINKWCSPLKSFFLFFLQEKNICEISFEDLRKASSGAAQWVHTAARLKKYGPIEDET